MVDSNQELIKQLIDDGYLKTPRIIEAFLKIDRINFLPKGIKDNAYINSALPIGWGQTISQPLVVAFMLELLQPRPDENILDVGFGSGWTSALLAYIIANTRELTTNIHKSKFKYKSDIRGKFGDIRESGKVLAIERIPELFEFGKNNIAKFNFIKKGIAECFCGNGSLGLLKIAKKIGGFDKILAGASAAEIPSAWKEQLKIGGKIVAPVGHSILLLTKKGIGDGSMDSPQAFEEKEYFGFSFVPLVSNNIKNQK